MYRFNIIHAVVSATTLLTHLSRGYLAFEALGYESSMAFLHKQVCYADVPRFHRDMQMDTHNTMQDGVECDHYQTAMHKCDEAVSSSTAPMVAQNHRLC